MKALLKTAMIERECFNKLTKLILEGPKYLVPLVDEIDVTFSSLKILANEPEKLLHVAGSLTIALTADFRKAGIISIFDRFACENKS